MRFASVTLICAPLPFTPGLGLLVGWTMCFAAHFPPVNASIVFQWARRVDHDPVVVDFLFLLRASPVLPPSSSSGKVLSSRLPSPELPSLQLQVAAGVTSRLSDFETLGRECACLVREGSAHSLPSARFEGTDGPFASIPPGKSPG